MSLRLSPEMTLLKRTVSDFARNEVKPRAAEIDELEEFPADLIKKAGKMGLMGVLAPKEYGGAGCGELAMCIIAEEISRYSLGVAAIISVHGGVGSLPIVQYGTKAQKERYLPGLASGETIAAFGLTEPSAGSDAANIKTVAARDGDFYILNGSKIWITNGNEAGLLTIMAVTDKSLGPAGISAFLVEKGTEGFEVGVIEHKLGIRGSSTAELVFTDCMVPAENILGGEGMGFKAAMRALDFGRLTLAASCVGMAQECLDLSVEFAKTRVQFKKPIIQHQGVMWLLSEIATEIYAGRCMVYEAAQKADRGERITTEAAMSKLFCSEMASRAANKAVQVHGGMGFMKKFPVERYFRDARVGEIVEGTSQVQKMVIGQSFIAGGR